MKIKEDFWFWQGARLQELNAPGHRLLPLLTMQGVLQHTLNRDRAEGSILSATSSAKGTETKQDDRLGRPVS